MNFDIRVEGIKEALWMVDPKVMVKATTSALNKVAASAYSVANKEIRDEYNIKLKDLRASTELTKATYARQWAEIRSRGGKGIPLIYFGARQRKGKGGGVYFSVRKGRRSFIPSAFIAKARPVKGSEERAEGVFIRVPIGYTKGGSYSTQRVARFPLKHFYGPSVTLLYGSRRIEKMIRKTALDNFARIHAHEYQYYRGRG